MSAADDIAALEGALALERGRVRKLAAERERCQAEWAERCDIVSQTVAEMTAQEVRAAERERWAAKITRLERCEGELRIAVQAVAAEQERYKTEIAAERERCAELRAALQALVSDIDEYESWNECTVTHSWDSVARARAAVREGE